MSRTVLAVDGNSLLHRAYHAGARTGFRTPDGHPAWAVRGLLSQLGAAVDRTCADVVVVGFDDRHHSVRRTRWPIYKAQRPPKPPTLEAQLDSAVEALTELGVHVVVPAGLEADDVLASVAAQAPRTGDRTVLATSDRDSFALVDEHTRVLRVLNGGIDASPLLDPRRLEQVCGVRPDQYGDLAALRGDASDNLPGVLGFGAKTAARLLAALGTAPDAFADAADGGERCVAAVGPARARTLATDAAREAWALNREVMAMVRTIDLGLDLHLDSGTVGRVPLPEDRVRTVYARHGLFVNGALRSLCLSDPEPTGARFAVAENGVGVEPDGDLRRARPYVDPRWSGGHVPRHPPLPTRPAQPQPVAATGPTYVQETLF